MTTRNKIAFKLKLDPADYDRLFAHSQAAKTSLTGLIRTAALERIAVDEFVARYREQFRRAG